MNIQSLSLEQLKQVISIKEQISSLEQKLAKLVGSPVAAVAAPAKKNGRSKMSAAAKAKISAAAKARWAKVKGSKPAKATKPAKAAVIAAPKTRKKPVLSPEGRAKIVAALKARWAKQKKGAKKG
ncbi:MAG: hypothetical protein WCH43_02405 [Verrucomicrobiota bacterium]